MGYDSVSGEYTFKEDTNAQVQFIVRCDVVDIMMNGTATDVTVNLLLNEDIIDSNTRTIDPGDTEEFNIVHPFRKFAEDDIITVELADPDPKYRVLEGATFEARQSPVPRVEIVEGGMWQRFGSNNQLRATGKLMSVYGRRIQAVNPGSTMPPATFRYSVEIGDEFRFGGEEELTFIVVGLSENLSRVVVEFNRDIPNTINISEFTHRRYVDDSSSIILNQAKNPGITSPIYVSPEYVTPGLKGRAGEVVKDLKSKNLI